MAAAVAGLVPVAQAARLGGTVAEHRGGLFTMSPDGRFLAGPVPEVPGLWVASGCNGSGFSSSPAIGEALARLDHRRPPAGGSVIPVPGAVRLAGRPLSPDGLPGGSGSWPRRARRPALRR